MGNLTDSIYEVGTVIDGRYRVIDVLGEGGMSTVYLCEHTLIRRYVAVKLMHAGLADDRASLERFLNEARAAGTLGHPNIIESTDMGFVEEGRRPYIVFEHLEGSLLTDEIYRAKGFSVKRAVQIAHQIASALGAAHEAAIIHRDVKSDNVFLVEQEGADADFVKVLDFGISKFSQGDRHTRRGIVMGTPEFMAPEQIHSPDAVDPRADVYALGVILYEMLEARRPFAANEDPRLLLHKIVHSAPPPFGSAIPDGLRALVMKMLAKHPDDRPQTMADVQEALTAFAPPVKRPARSFQRLTPRPFTAPSAPPPNRVPSPRGIEYPVPSARSDPRAPVSLQHIPSKRPGWLIAALAASVTAVGGLAFYIVTRGDGTPAAPVAPVAAAAAALPAASMPAPARPEKVELLIDSAAPGAQVTFRRRVSPLPLRSQIAPSDIVELVEVSAPGHRTVRYWLTFDRPTTLLARLSKGPGSVEATELETMVALGEAAPSIAPAPAATPRAEVARAPEAPKRKIGKDASPTKPVEVAKTVPQQPPVALPTPTAKAGSADAPKPTKPDPKIVAKTETPPEPSAPKPAEPPKPVEPPNPAPAIAEPVKAKAVPATAIEASRIAGQRSIVPDDTTKVAIANSGTSKIIAAAKLCLAVTGAIDGVTILKSSGYPAYDQRIQKEMLAWRFKPIVVDGKATPVCTSITFIYNQR